MGNRSSSSATDSRPQVPDNWSASGVPPQKGKIAIVTGANSGIGYETALELARKGADVILACRNEGRGKEAEQKLRQALASTPDAGSVEFKMLDVSDLGSVNKFADEFKATHDRLDLLINNAGVMAVPYAKTVDGYERQFATNHLGHFALTAQLFPLLKQSTPSRVVNVSSLAHLGARLEHFTSGSQIMRADDKGYSASEVYSESKLCNLLFTFEVSRLRTCRGDVGGRQGCRKYDINLFNQVNEIRICLYAKKRRNKYLQTWRCRSKLFSKLLHSCYLRGLLETYPHRHI